MVSRRVARTATTPDEEVAALHRVHYRSLVRLATLHLDDVGTGEEVVPDAFVRRQLGWGRLAEADRAPAYLRTSVCQRRPLPPAPPPGPGPPPPAGARPASPAEVAALRRLAPRQCEALLLRYYLDLSEQEMASVMGISADLGGVDQAHVHRGLATLHSCLGGTR